MQCKENKLVGGLEMARGFSMLGVVPATGLAVAAEITFAAPLDDAFSA